MNLKQHYQAKAAKSDRLAEDPYQTAQFRVEFRSLARRWRHLAEMADWRARRSRYPER